MLGLQCVVVKRAGTLFFPTVGCFAHLSHQNRMNPRTDRGQIKFSDYHSSYIGKTGRNLNTILTEHKQATRKGDANNHIAIHRQLTNHTIDWDSSRCLTYISNYFQQMTVESWYTNIEQVPLNICQQLSAPYKTTYLGHKQNQ